MIDVLQVKVARALKQTGHSQLVVAGGVGANKALRQRLQEFAKDNDKQVFFPRSEFCTDNGAMIAYTGCCYLSQGKHNTDFAIRVKPRWPIDTI